MAGRAVSEANVMSKQNKMGKQLGLLVEQNKRVEFHHDMQWLKSELLENPDKMAGIKAVAKIKVCKPKEKNPSTTGLRASTLNVCHFDSSKITFLSAKAC
jgi:hypothetical protein